MPETPPVQVAYDVADLLDRIGTRLDAGFATVNGKLDGKADKSDLAVINARLDEQNKRIIAVENWQREKDAESAAHHERDVRDDRRRNWYIALAACAATVIIALASLLPQIFR